MSEKYQQYLNETDEHERRSGYTYPEWLNDKEEEAEEEWTS